MARNTKICIPIISLAACGTLVMGMAQFASALPARSNQSALLLADAAPAAAGSGSTASPAAANPAAANPAAANPAAASPAAASPAAASPAAASPAAANPAAANPAAVTAGSTNDAAAQVTSLKQEQTQLRRMAEAIKRTRRAGMDIIGECTQPLEMMGEIDIIGQDIIPIMPATSEGFGNNYIPPRPKYIKLHMAQLAQMIPILQDDIDTLTIPDSEKGFADQPMQDLDGYMGDIRQHYKKLKSLTKSGDYDQIPLINEARGIDASCKAIESARKKLMHEDDKAERKEEKLERSQDKK